MQLVPGDIIAGRYTIVAPIKSGGMGAVYRAMDSRFRDREVAIKIMLEDFSAGIKVDLVNQKFDEEANILIRLSHPQIPRVYDHFVDGNRHYIVMDYIEGDGLETLLEEYLALTGKPVPEKLAVDYGIQLCGILSYLHEQKPKPIIHRDIKPGNIILRKMKTEVVLVDFGLARTINPRSASMRTKVGTVGYSPIEQYKGQSEPRSDIYALGVTLHHLISGQLPIPFRIPPLQLARPSVLPELATVINKSIQDDINLRYQTADEMKKDLEAVLRILEKRSVDPDSGEIAEPDGQITAELIPTAEIYVDKEEQAGEGLKKAVSTRIGDTEDIESAVEQDSAVFKESLPQLPSKISSFITGSIGEQPGYLVLLNNKNTQKYILALVFSFFLLFIANAVRNRTFGAFRMPFEARRTWKTGRRQGVFMSGSGLVLETTKNNGRSGILFERKGKTDLLPASMRFRVRKKTGRPDFFIFIGPYGLNWTDDRNFGGNTYKPKLVKTRLNMETVKMARWMDSIGYEPLAALEIPIDERYDEELSLEEKGVEIILQIKKNSEGRGRITAGIMQENGHVITFLEGELDRIAVPSDFEHLGIMTIHSGTGSSSKESIEIGDIEVVY